MAGPTDQDKLAEEWGLDDVDSPAASSDNAVRALPSGILPMSPPREPQLIRYPLRTIPMPGTHGYCFRTECTARLAERSDGSVEWHERAVQLRVGRGIELRHPRFAKVQPPDFGFGLEDQRIQHEQPGGVRPALAG